MERIFYLTPIIGVLLISCASDEPIVNAPCVPQESKSYSVSVPEAISRANKLMTVLDLQSLSTRSMIQQREVISIDIMKSETLTRSISTNLQDTLFYIIHYADNAGFAIVSADKRTSPVYAISNEGTFDINDTVYNKGLAQFFENMSADMSHSIAKIRPNPIDTLLPPDIDIDIKTEEVYGPYLSKSQADWKQTFPFNKFCFNDEGERCYVGCLAVAAGQIISYFKHPDYYNNHNYNWDLINTDHYCDDLAYLLSDLGRSENLNMDYATDGSEAYFGNLGRTFYNMGYEHCGYGKSFTREVIKQYLKTGPVYFSGRRHDNEGNSLGHAFVCDGYFEYLQSATLPNQEIMYHIVWGWGGKNNGYYYWTDGFDVDNPAKPDSDEPFVNMGRYYDHGLNIWGDFKVRVQ